MRWAILIGLMIAATVQAEKVPWDERPTSPSWWQPANPNGVNPEWGSEHAGTGARDAIHSGHVSDPPYQTTMTWEKRTQTDKPYMVSNQLSIYGHWSPDTFMNSTPEFLGAWFGLCTDMNDAYPPNFENPAWLWYELTWAGGDGGPDALHWNAWYWGDVTIPELGETWLAGRLLLQYQATANEEIRYDLQAQMVPEPAALALLGLGAMMIGKRCGASQNATSKS